MDEDGVIDTNDEYDPRHICSIGWGQPPWYSWCSSTQEVPRTSLWRLNKKYSIYYIVVGELESFEWFVKHLFHTDSKVCNVLIAYSHAILKSSLFSSIFSFN